MVDYIDNLLSGFSFLDGATGAIYPSGPYRDSSSGGPGFYSFQELSRVKKIGWEQQVLAWQSLYTDGLTQLDGLAPGGFAAAPSAAQIAILEGLDASGSDFFAALFDHTMEGTYSHPVYGGNQGYGAWKTFGFAGDVHGVRYSQVDTTWTSSSPWLPTDPSTGQGAWTIYGGYAPDEMNVQGHRQDEGSNTEDPAESLHVPQVVEIPSDTQDTQTGSNPACAFSGFTPTDTGLYEVKIVTPPLCATCVRLFIDYAAIKPSSLGTYSQGHAFYRPSSANPSYSSSPTAHSPNIKNFTNDYLVSPPGSAQSQVFSNVDPHLLTYAADTAHFAHTTLQGPYYIGPWYVNQYGDRIDGAYVDVDLAQATQLGQAVLDDIYYGAGYNTDPSLCPDTLANPAYNDANYFYAVCINAFGISSDGIDPWPGG